MKIAVVTAITPERLQTFNNAAPPDMDLNFVADNAPDEEKIEGMKDADAVILAAPTANITAGWR